MQAATISELWQQWVMAIHIKAYNDDIDLQYHFETAQDMLDDIVELSMHLTSFAYQY